HTLQLVVHHALKNQTISKCSAGARNIVEHFKKSELACSKLKLKQQQMETAQNMLVEDHWPVTAVLSDPMVIQKGKHHLDLKPEQWHLLDELKQALEPFVLATDFMSGEQYVTVSSLPPLERGLQKTMNSVTFDMAAVQAFHNSAIEQLNNKWEGVKNLKTDSSEPNIVLIASALDPRFRRMKFLSTEEMLNVQRINTDTCSGGQG
ncbi:hypothetical protein Z043_126221, partial [Scleropages formosus]